MKGRSDPRIARTFRQHDPDGDDSERNNTASNQVNVLENRLLSERRVLVFGTIDDKLARDVCARLLTLASESSNPIDVFINSPGGHVESGDTIHDMVRFIDSTAPVRMVGTGWVASAGATIYLGARKEHRYALPNTRFMLHQPLGGAQGQATDIAIEAREIVKIRERINRLIAEATGQQYEKVAEDTDRNYWMTAGEALEYGVVGRLIQSLADLRL
ncbi:Endopeptidase Clp [Burkholderia sp. H160]|nr:Endopeptidase Clp [Burkholderia sp. H160]